MNNNIEPQTIPPIPKQKWPSTCATLLDLFSVTSAGIWEFDYIYWRNSIDALGLQPNSKFYKTGCDDELVHQKFVNHTMLYCRNFFPDDDNSPKWLDKTKR